MAQISLPGRLLPRRKGQGCQHLLPVYPGRGGVFAGSEQVCMFHRTGELEFKAKIVLRIGVAFWILVWSVVLSFGANVRNPRGAGFTYRAVLRIFIADPLGCPFLLPFDPFPPAHVACRVRLSVLVPNLHPPVVPFRSS